MVTCSINGVIEKITGYAYSELCKCLPDGDSNNWIPHIFDEIINEALSSVSSVEKPFLLNISGIPGSGKSTWCRRIMELSTNILYISFDEIMNDIRLPYCTGEKQNAQKAFEQWELPARIAGYELLGRAVSQKKNILFEHSSSVPEHLLLFEFLLDNGYEVHFRYIPVSVTEARKRITERTGKEGRVVPYGYVEDRYKKLYELLPEYKKLCTTYKVLPD